MVAATVNFSILVKVDEVDEKFIASGAGEAGRMPAHARPSPRRKHGHFTSIYLFSTLLTNGMHGCPGEQSDGASAQRLLLALSAEHLQLLLLLLAQRLAVPHLVVVWRELVQQLFAAVLFSKAINIGDLLLWQAGEVQLHLLWPEAGRNPRVLFKCASGIVIRGRAPLTPEGKFVYLLLHFQRHR